MGKRRHNRPPPSWWQDFLDRHLGTLPQLGVSTAVLVLSVAALIAVLQGRFTGGALITFAPSSVRRLLPRSDR